MTSFAPQFLVEDLDRSIAYFRKLGFEFGEPWDGFYAIGTLDGLELHLKEAPQERAERQSRRDNEHLDAAAAVQKQAHNKTRLPSRDSDGGCDL